MARESEFHRFRRRALDRDAFPQHAKRLPAVLVLVLRRIGGIQFVDVKVFLVDVEDGQAEGDGAIVAQRNAGQRRFAGADHVQAGGRQMHQVAQAGRGIGAVRVVRHDRAPGRGLRTVDHPAVAAFRRVFPRFRFFLVKRVLVKGRQCHRCHGDRGLRGLRRRPGDPHALGGKLEHLQDVRGQAGVQPLGHLRLPVVAQTEANLVGVDVLRLAQGIGTRDFRGEVAREAMRTDADHIIGRPPRGLILEESEFPRHPRRIRLEPVDVGIDAVDKTLRDRLRLAGVAGAVDAPLAIHVAAIQEQARRAVLVDELRAEYFGKLPKAAAAPQVDLKQPVARGIEALREKHVRRALRINVGHAPAIDTHLDGGAQPCDAQRLRGKRRFACGRGQRQHRGCEQGGANHDAGVH